MCGQLLRPLFLPQLASELEACRKASPWCVGSPRCEGRKASCLLSKKALAHVSLAGFMKNALAYQKEGLGYCVHQALEFAAKTVGYNK